MRLPVRTPSGWATARRIWRAHVSDYIQVNHYHISRIKNGLLLIESYMNRFAPDSTSQLKSSGDATYDRHISVENRRLKIKFDKMLDG